MAQEIECANCHKHMGILRDAKVRKGMVVYCEECNQRMKTLLKMQYKPSAKYDVPDFMRGLFGG